MIVINSEKTPIKIWLDKIDDITMDQAKNLANLPHAFMWVAIMPDAQLDRLQKCSRFAKMLRVPTKTLMK